VEVEVEQAPVELERRVEITDLQGDVVDAYETRAPLNVGHGFLLCGTVWDDLTVATFVLVHGAWHGAWCWDLVRPALERRGHKAIAVDLPCDDVSSGSKEYAQVVCDAFDEEAVLVGHSLGGLTIPLVATARPVRKLVFLGALLPEPGVAFVDQLPGKPPASAEGFGRDIARDDEGRSYWPEGTARAGMYPDCDEESAAWAIPQLRPQARAPSVEPCPLRRGRTSNARTCSARTTARSTRCGRGGSRASAWAWRRSSSTPATRPS